MVNLLSSRLLKSNPSPLRHEGTKQHKFTDLVQLSGLCVSVASAFSSNLLKTQCGFKSTNNVSARTLPEASLNLKLSDAGFVAN
jgi:hypothetical protein